MQEIAIKVENLTKKFDNNLVIQNINLSANKGELLGILGPNGAGKSTLINILSTILKPDEGNAYINEISVIQNPVEVKTKISVVPQEYVFYQELTARENLIFFGAMHQRPKKDLIKDTETILSRLGLSDRKDKTKNFSGGMKRRLNIAISLVMGTEIIFLDEPTAGLDPQAKHAVWEYIMELKNQNKTIILLTHDMHEAEILCDRILILDRGSIVANGSPHDLIQKYSKRYALELTFKNKEFLTEFNTTIQSFGDQKSIILEDENKINLYFDGGFSNFVKIVQEKHFVDLNKLESINLRQTTLEDIFLQLTGRRLA
ncbi:MAG: ABC transporter ATP-binding protein [Candidatus Hodarchaeales archaeon]|jgi:ABC-2 type transport system ATP-binding protein